MDEVKGVQRFPSVLRLLKQAAPLQVLTLQYSGTNNFNPSASGQNGSPAGPTLTVVSLMPSLQSIALQACSAKLQGAPLPFHITSQHPVIDTQLRSVCRSRPPERL